MLTPFHWLPQLFRRLVSFLEQAFLHLTQPSRHSIVLSAVADLTRHKADRMAENDLLRQQLIILRRQVKTPSVSQADRLWLVLLASRVKKWKAVLLIFNSDTLLRWHRRDFRLFWKFTSQADKRERTRFSARTGVKFWSGEVFGPHNCEGSPAAAR